MTQRFVFDKANPHRDSIEANAIVFIGRLPKTKSWVLEISPYVAEFSRKQQKSIFGPAYKALMEFSGLQGDADKKELHTHMCGEFFGWKELPFGRKPVRRTTTDEDGNKNPITTVVALEFYAFLQRQGAEVGCFVPDPDPLWNNERFAA